MASHGVPRPTTIVTRSEAARQEELAKINQYQDLVHLIQDKANKREYTPELFDLTTKLLKKNPEFFTIWNVRRRLLISFFSSRLSASPLPSKELRSGSPTNTSKIFTENASSYTSTSSMDSTGTQPGQNPPSPGKNGLVLEEIEKDLRNELNFLVPLLMEYPKCYWIWNYRLWLLGKVIEYLEVPKSRKIWQEELALVGKMLVRDSRNFHGWGYRRTLVAQLESEELQGRPMVEEEFAYTTKMITSSLSNFSAWHYRSKLIPQLLNHRGADDTARRDFQDKEFDLIKTALWTDPNDQSIWFYYQFLMTTLTDKSGFDIMCPDMTVEERVAFVGNQLDELREMQEDEDCKWLLDALVEYSIARSTLAGRKLSPDERNECQEWLSKLKQLDDLRSGRWDALQQKLEATS